MLGIWILDCSWGTIFNRFFFFVSFFCFRLGFINNSFSVLNLLVGTRKTKLGL